MKEGRESNTVNLRVPNTQLQELPTHGHLASEWLSCFISTPTYFLLSPTPSYCEKNPRHLSHSTHKYFSMSSKL